MSKLTKQNKSFYKITLPDDRWVEETQTCLRALNLKVIPCLVHSVGFSLYRTSILLEKVFRHLQALYSFISEIEYQIILGVRWFLYSMYLNRFRGVILSYWNTFLLFRELYFYNLALCLLHGSFVESDEWYL